jgi:hypothetical protein
METTMFEVAEFLSLRAGARRLRVVRRTALGRRRGRALGHIVQGGARLASTHRSDAASRRGASHMTKFYSLIAAAAVFVPVALSVMTQAAQIVA